MRSGLRQNSPKMKLKMSEELFYSREQLRGLRAIFGCLSSKAELRECGMSVFGLFQHVRELPEPKRAQLAANNIRWLSRIARLA